MEKCKARFSYCLILGPLFINAPTYGPYPAQNMVVVRDMNYCSVYYMWLWLDGCGSSLVPTFEYCVMGEL